MATFTLPDADPGITVVGPFIFEDGVAEFDGKLGPNLQRLVEIYGIQEGAAASSSDEEPAESEPATPTPAPSSPNPGIAQAYSAPATAPAPQADVDNASASEVHSTDSDTSGAETLDASSSTGH